MGTVASKAYSSCATGYVLNPMVIQLPSVENTVPTGDLSLAFIEHWVLTCEKISGE